MFILVSLYFMFFSSCVDSFCYWIDGTESTVFSPCYALDSVGASMCCDASDGFKCLSSGICRSTPYGPLGPYDNGSSYWRAGCSDNTWQDGACLAMAPWITNEISQLGLCADGSFCPRDQTGPNTTCCNNNRGQQAALGGATIAASVISSIQAARTTTSSTVPVAPSTSISSTVSVALSTSISVGSTAIGSASPLASSSSPNPSPPEPSSNAWISGAVIGPVFAIFLGIVVFLLIRQRKPRNGHNKGPVTYEKPELHAESIKAKELEAPDRTELAVSEPRSIAPVFEIQ